MKKRFKKLTYTNHNNAKLYVILQLEDGTAEATLVLADGTFNMYMFKTPLCFDDYIKYYGFKVDSDYEYTKI